MALQLQGGGNKDRADEHEDQARDRQTFLAAFGPMLLRIVRIVENWNTAADRNLLFFFVSGATAAAVNLSVHFILIYGRIGIVRNPNELR